MDTITIYQLSEYALQLEESEKQLYVEKLTKCDIDCPYFIPSQNWVIGANKIEEICPSFTEHDIYVYLIAQRSNDTGLQLRAFKTIEDGNKMIRNGWISKLSAVRLRSGSVIFKARAKHSMSFQSQPDLSMWVGVHQEGSIMAAHCTCVAGLGGVCSHVGGLLYSILNLICTPCTSKENTWICSRKTIPANLKTSVVELQGAKRSSPSSIEREKKFLAMPKMTDADKEHIHLLLLENKAVQLYVVNEFCDSFIPPALPTRLTTIYKSDFATGKTFEDILQECKRLLKEELMVTAEQAREAERLTIKQRKSHFWFDIRIGYCTGSVMYQVCHTNTSNPSLSLIKRICFPGKQLSTPPINYGIENETKCIKSGLAYIKRTNLHSGCKTSKAGFVISTEQPGLAASPDGYFTCECHGKGVIEAKCVWSHRHEKLSQVATSSKDFFLTFDSSSIDYQFSLKNTHPYYYQVQAQMLVTSTSFCIFMVYTDVNIAVACVTPDPIVVQEIKDKSSLFFLNVLLPQMLAEWFVKTKFQPLIDNPVQILEDDVLLESRDLTNECETRSSTSTPLTEFNVIPFVPPTVELSTSNLPSLPSTHLTRTVYSCCTKEDKGPKVVCSNINCLISVYHKDCVKPPRVRFGKNWICKPCADLVKKNKRIVDKENSKKPVVPSKARKGGKCNALRPKN